MSAKIHHPSGAVIFRQGYPGDHAYVIEEGSVEIYNEWPDGREESIAILTPGQMFGEIALTDDAPRSASARAKTDIILQIVNI